LGKSTLLGLICGIVSPQKGIILVDGEDLTALRPAKRDRLRAEKISAIFQMFNLVPYLSARNNILLPLRFAPTRRQRCPDPTAEAEWLGQDLGLDPLLLRSRVAELRVGQQQRVAVAHAFIANPLLIVAGEATSALDKDAQHAFMDLLFGQAAATGASLLMVSHDDRLAIPFDRWIHLSDIVRTTERAAG